MMSKASRDCEIFQILNIFGLHIMELSMLKVLGSGGRMGEEGGV